jgi:hypothetical protein
LYTAPERGTGRAAAIEQRSPRFAVHGRGASSIVLAWLAGVDRDLATIVTTSIAPDPRDRYPNAAALASDLKAFVAGARIASRSYSLPAMLAHWRHRRLAIAAAAAAVTALGGSAWRSPPTASRSPPTTSTASPASSGSRTVRSPSCAATPRA